MILVAVGSNLNSKSFGSPEQNCNAAIDNLQVFTKLNLFQNLNSHGL